MYVMLRMQERGRVDGDRVIKVKELFRCKKNFRTLNTQNSCDHADIL